MAQSDARFAYRAKLSRTDHDLGQKFGFTCPPGMLLPIWMDFATPSDTYYIQHDLTFMRTAPLIAPAMIDCYVHYETFFVPMQMIFQPFENAVFSLKPILSSLYDSSNLRNMQLPTLDMNLLEQYLHSNMSNERYFEYRRLLDMLDFNYNLVQGVHTSHSNDTYSFPMFPCAYQCIYEHYYRLDDKEEFNNKVFNLDRYYASDITIDGDAERMFYMRFRPLRFDYYSSVYRSPIVSSMNTQQVMPQASYEYLFDGSSNVDSYFGQTVPLNNQGTPTTSNDSTRGFSSRFVNGQQLGTLNAGVSTVLIRQMFANEKLAMITGRTRKNYDSQVLAHYGVTVPHDVKHDITLIGRDTYQLRVGEVTSLASTELSPLGEIAGKGFASGSSGKKHKFQAPCHGVVMTIFSIEPIKRYHHTTSRLNLLTNITEFPTPEYDRLGNMPMLANEVSAAFNADENVLGIMGWKERYYFCKRKQDRVSVAFMHQTQSLDEHHPTMTNLNPYAAYFVSSVPMQYDYRDMVSNVGGLTSYQIRPSIMNDLMMVPYHASWIEEADGENWMTYPYLAYARDPFIVDSDMKVKKVSWMSKDGEPVYNY